MTKFKGIPISSSFRELASILSAFVQIKLLKKWASSNVLDWSVYKRADPKLPRSGIPRRMNVEFTALHPKVVFSQKVTLATPHHVHRTFQEFIPIHKRFHPSHSQVQCCTGPCCSQNGLRFQISSDQVARGCISYTFFHSTFSGGARLSWSQSGSTLSSKLQYTPHAQFQMFLSRNAVAVPTARYRRSLTYGENNLWLIQLIKYRCNQQTNAESFSLFSNSALRAAKEQTPITVVQFPAVSHLHYRTATTVGSHFSSTVPAPR